jgi:hypothetical protein
MHRSVVVGEVVGMHAGRCGPARVAQVQRELEALPLDAFSWSRLCSCGFRDYDSVIKSQKRYERLPGSRNLNVLTIRLSRPPDPPLTRFATIGSNTPILVVIEAPGNTHPVVVIGHEKLRGTSYKTYYTGFGMAHALFGLERPNAECAVSP